MNIKARLEFKLADLWIGVFWSRRTGHWIPSADRKTGMLAAKRSMEVLHVWICFVPCLPLHVQITWGYREEPIVC